MSCAVLLFVLDQDHKSHAFCTKHILISAMPTHSEVTQLVWLTSRETRRHDPDCDNTLVPTSESCTTLELENEMTIPPPRDAIALLMLHRHQASAPTTRRPRRRASAKLPLMHRLISRRLYTVSKKHVAAIKGTRRLCRFHCPCRLHLRLYWNTILWHDHLRALPYVYPFQEPPRQRLMFNMFANMGIDYEGLIWRNVLRNHHRLQAVCDARAVSQPANWAWPLLTSTFNQAVPGTPETVVCVPCTPEPLWVGSSPEPVCVD